MAIAQGHVGERNGHRGAEDGRLHEKDPVEAIPADGGRVHAGAHDAHVVGDVDRVRQRDRDRGDLDDAAGHVCLLHGGPERTFAGRGRLADAVGDVVVRRVPGAVDLVDHRQGGKRHRDGQEPAQDRKSLTHATSTRPISLRKYESASMV